MNASANKVAQILQTRSSGFTLIELMVTISVLAIIVSIAAPSISNQLARKQMQETVSLIKTSIDRAKAESAVSRKDITWSYNTINKQIKLSNGSDTLASYSLSSNSLLTFTPATVTSLVIKKEGFIITVAGTAANVAIDVSDNRANTTIKRVRINNKRAFECSETNC